MKKGLIQVYTGDGKGKTTAAIGLGVRAVGRGYKVAMIQFLKAMETGELKSLERISGNFKVYRFEGTTKFFWEANDEEKEMMRKCERKAFEFAKELCNSGNIDILILDEIMLAMYNKLLTVDEVCEFLKNKPENIEIILTGRYAPQEILDAADLVTEMRLIKHPFEKGIPAREGIEF
ncbi:MAG: cob(I)yrinic acid a,c-diamide adenosyltransferase [Thermoanaerobacteraceae bacterium]|nr:cob(I)yrinic acid a,c-diamide adenosyltransferase [Thermoanaerobacteraceae bacterium]